MVIWICTLGSEHNPIYRNSRVCKSDFSLGWCDINGSGEGGGRPGALLGTFHILVVVKTSVEKGP